MAFERPRLPRDRPISRPSVGVPVAMECRSKAHACLAAFQQYGMQPGPLLFERSGNLVWALLASLFIGLVILVMINIPFASVWAKLPSIPQHYLYAGITVFSMLGVYAVSSAVLDLWLLIGIGLIGFLMRRYNIPLAPELIAVILGPIAETQLRRAPSSTSATEPAVRSSYRSKTIKGP